MSELFLHPVVEGTISTSDSKDSRFLSVVVHALLDLMQRSAEGTCMCMLLPAAYVHTQLHKVCDEDLIPASHCIILHTVHKALHESA